MVSIKSLNLRTYESVNILKLPSQLSKFGIDIAMRDKILLLKELTKVKLTAVLMLAA